VVGDDQSNKASNIVGDVNVEIKLTEDGRFRVKAFNRSNYNSVYDVSSYDDIAPYTQGVGVFYRKDFNSFGELFRKKNKKKMVDQPKLK
jgi:TamB, inner membrane protein subunit of TAM complex